MAVTQKLPVAFEVLDQFCKRWKITKLEEFDSRYAGFQADLYLMATNAPDANWGLLEHNAAEFELGELLGKKIELVSRRGVEMNPIATSGILETARLFYGAE
jgi:uncharacterized protein